jgi:serine/threonine protein kinase
MTCCAFAISTQSLKRSISLVLSVVMEDFGGIALSKYCQTHSLSLVDILAIAVQLADILHELYQHRVIHKDIKPANILIHPESQQIKLIDFSIASLLPKETKEVKHPNVLEGTLAYIAPEQTGRMNRGIDYRTDFYSLGVTLFELLTGRLPFQTALLHESKKDELRLRKESTKLRLCSYLVSQSESFD